MRIYLFGHTGFIGGWILKYFSEHGFDVRTIRTDVTDLAQIREVMKDVHDSVVINTTGKTGKPNVDWCEDHRLETAKVNICGAINICETASNHGNYVIQIGSGCVFHYHPEFQMQNPKDSGIYAFTEEDSPNFFGSYYSQTKAVVEGALKEIPNVCVLRIRMPLQASPHPKNLLDKLLQYEKILSVPNSVTIMEDFMPFIERVIEKRFVGILNAVNPGIYEHRQLLELYREIVDPSRSFEYIGLEDFSGMTRAARSNCVLSTHLAEKLGISMPPVAMSLRKLVEHYKTKSVFI